MQAARRRARHADGTVGLIWKLEGAEKRRRGARACPGLPPRHFDPAVWGAVTGGRVYAQIPWGRPFFSAVWLLVRAARRMDFTARIAPRRRYARRRAFVIIIIILQDSRIAIARASCVRTVPRTPYLVRFPARAIVLHAISVRVTPVRLSLMRARSQQAGENCF